MKKGRRKDRNEEIINTKTKKKMNERNYEREKDEKVKRKRMGLEKRGIKAQRNERKINEEKKKNENLK